MSVFIVGGDKLGNIPEKLGKFGYKDIKHFCGRKCKNCKNLINIEKFDFVLVLVDYVSHPLCKSIKDSARNSNMPVIFSKRSWVNIEKSLKELVF